MKLNIFDKIPTTELIPYVYLNTEPEPYSLYLEYKLNHNKNPSNYYGQLFFLLLPNKTAILVTF